MSRSKANYQKVGTHDLRVEYAYAQVRTETPITTAPDIIDGKVRETVAIDFEYKKFDTKAKRNAFVSNFDAKAYIPKPRTKRNFRGMGIDKITGKTYAVSVKAVKVSQVARNKIV